MAFSDDHAGRCEPGRSARVQIDPSPRAIAGKVVKGSKDGTKAGACEVELSDAVPAGTTIGQKVGALIEVGELTDVVFFGRPARSSANSEATIFVLEPGSSFARRATVRYGKMSGPLIQVVEGLAPGGRVIGTDMSKWAAYPRVRIQ
jgi:HlyD family secretion protein